MRGCRSCLGVVDSLLSSTPLSGPALLCILFCRTDFCPSCFSRGACNLAPPCLDQFRVDFRPAKVLDRSFVLLLFEAPPGSCACQAGLACNLFPLFRSKFPAPSLCESGTF